MSAISPFSNAQAAYAAKPAFGGGQQAKQMSTKSFFEGVVGGLGNSLLHPKASKTSGSRLNTLA
jgi:hypothetical protein